jgi:hypothetical protein
MKAHAAARAGEGDPEKPLWPQLVNATPCPEYRPARVKAERLPWFRVQLFSPSRPVVIV